MVEEELINFTASTLSLKRGDWALDTPFEDIDGWTSLGYMELITAIEDKLSIQLSMDAIMDCETLSDLCLAISETQA